MATNSPDSPALPATDIADNNNNNNLQPFFVLHKATSSHSKSKNNKRVNKTPKTKRRIDLSPIGNDDNTEKSDYHSDDDKFVSKRMEVFEAVWSKIESTIQDVLRNLTMSAFNEIFRWTQESFNAITSSGNGVPSFRDATQSFPIVEDVTSKRLYTGLILTKNMEFVDDLLTFKELGLHLKSQGCHVANLSSLDFSVKNGIGGCLRSLLRQLVMIALDAPDISVLATWYREQGNCSYPVVIIVDDLERCCGSVLSDFILMLSEWVLKIPIILIMEVATTLDAMRNILPSNILHHLSPCKFTLGTPSERMDAIVEAVLVKHCSGFSIGHKVAVFMRNYFVNQDGTITSFIRALKIACALHFSLEPLSSMLLWFLLEEDHKVLDGENYGLPPEDMFKHAFQLPSSLSNKMAEQTGDTLVHGLSELKKSRSQWSTVVMCLYEAGKCDNIRLLDLFCEALDPESDLLRISDSHRMSRKDSTLSPRKGRVKPFPGVQKDGFISKALRKVRDLPAKQLHEVLKGWEKYSDDVPQIHDRVKELLSTLRFDESKSSKQDLTGVSKRTALRNHLNFEDSCAANQKIVRLAEYMVRNHMQPIESSAFHEIVCFKSVDNLRAALIGDPRRRIQVDLLEFHNIIQCNCCGRGDKTLLPSLHDSSIMYTLSQEHGDLINLFDWYQSFKKAILSSSNKVKLRTKHSPSPKKRKVTTEPAKPSEASIQARFCRAITELQITGLIRMPGKRRPDFVQRVAFGL